MPYQKYQLGPGGTLGGRDAVDLTPEENAIITNDEEAYLEHQNYKKKRN